MRAAYALFSDPDLARIAVDGLRAAGFADGDIVVLSSAPLESEGPGAREPESRMSRFAVLGGAIGCAIGASLTAFTQLALPLDTGGMPIVAVWPNLIVTFELTMLGAILATVAGFVWRAGLGQRLPAFYDPAVSEGKILVGIANLAESRVRAVEQVLGSGEVKRVTF